jgi:hypothetical protein
MHPLNTLLLRAYRMDPVEILVKPAYAGCTSWIELAEGIPVDLSLPAVTDEEFRLRAEQVRRAIETPRPNSLPVVVR